MILEKNLDFIHVQDGKSSSSFYAQHNRKEKEKLLQDVIHHPKAWFRVIDGYFFAWWYTIEVHLHDQNDNPRKYWFYCNNK